MKTLNHNEVWILKKRDPETGGNLKYISVYFKTKSTSTDLGLHVDLTFTML